jgi:hypothetical protein
LSPENGLNQLSSQKLLNSPYISNYFELDVFRVAVAGTGVGFVVLKSGKEPRFISNKWQERNADRIANGYLRKGVDLSEFEDEFYLVICHDFVFSLLTRCKGRLAGDPACRQQSKMAPRLPAYLRLTLLVNTLASRR